MDGYGGGGVGMETVVEAQHGKNGDRGKYLKIVVVEDMYVKKIKRCDSSGVTVTMDTGVYFQGYRR